MLHGTLCFPFLLPLYVLATPNYSYCPCQILRKVGYLVFHLFMLYITQTDEKHTCEYFLKLFSSVILFVMIFFFLLKKSKLYTLPKQAFWKKISDRCNPWCSCSLVRSFTLGLSFFSVYCVCLRQWNVDKKCIWGAFLYCRIFQF